MGNYEPNQAIIQAALEMDKRSEELFIEQAYKDASEIQKQKRMKMEDFQDLYEVVGVEKDIKEVDKKKEKQRLDDTPEQKEAKKLSVIMEVMLYDQINKSDWFGDETDAVLASEYDDFNGIDIILEIAEDEHSAKHMGIALDATFSKDLVKKFHNLKDNIDQGKLSRVKYFKSERLDIRGELGKIPRLIIGTNRPNTLELARLWDTKKRRALSVHPVQLLFLKQIEYQLIVLRDYLAEMGKEDFVGKMERRLSLIQPIIEQKEKDFPNFNWEADEISKAIIQAMRSEGFIKRKTARN